MGGSFGVDGFAGGEDGFLAVDETVDVIDDLQIVRLAVHFGQRVEAFDDSAVGGIGFLAGRFGRAGDDGSLLAVAVGEEGDEFLIRFLQSVSYTHLDVYKRQVINKQYDYMVNVDPGYAYEKLAYCSTQGVEESVRNTAIEELRKIPEVDKVSACYDLPISGMSGNNVSLPGDDRELFNIADMYWVKDDFFSLMEIPVIEGEVFRSCLLYTSRCV